jgi:ferredoxin
MPRSPVHYRIRVNPILCDGFGYCAEILPELLSIDEWGYPVVADKVVPTGLLEMARMAVHECPRRALLLQVVEKPVAPPTPRRAKSR